MGMSQHTQNIWKGCEQTYDLETQVKIIKEVIRTYVIWKGSTMVSKGFTDCWIMGQEMGGVVLGLWRNFVKIY